MGIIVHFPALREKKQWIIESNYPFESYNRKKKVEYFGKALFFPFSPPIFPEPGWTRTKEEERKLEKIIYK
jgi:hypothetical protein